MFGPELVQAFNEFKAIWDPDWKMNPGKVVQPYRIDENLRYGPNYRPNDPPTHFKFPGDNFSFAHAVERCVGVGKCRREDAGTMCPSYMVTREEMHSTRGRARLLFEMLRGDVIQTGWRSKAVKEALDLCLACKGCKSECPVNVDIATYKAEFLSHYYQRRLRPRHAYAFGLIHRWARLASHFPRLANFFSQTVPFSTILKWLAGIASERQLPEFAHQTFTDWFAARPSRLSLSPLGETTGVRGSVLLWPDTFNNFFHPYIARAAVEVLEDAGFRVEVPRQNMCCGRPLYDYGMLDTAEKWLRHILENLRSEISNGIPMIVLEPSCCAVFREELTNLLANDQDAQRLRQQTFTLGEFIAKYAPEYPRKELKRHAIVHGHCHQKSILGMDCEEEILKRLALQYEMLDAGCCGMAGAFGFEKEHYDISVKCGERVLLPKVRQTDHDTLIITNGFSCHEQILQLGARPGLHLAEVLHLAMREGTPRRKPLPKQTEKSEGHFAEDEREPIGETHHSRWRLIGASLAAVAGVGGAWLWHHNHRNGNGRHDG